MPSISQVQCLKLLTHSVIFTPPCYFHLTLESNVGGVSRLNFASEMTLCAFPACDEVTPFTTQANRALPTFSYEHFDIKVTKYTNSIIHWKRPKVTPFRVCRKQMSIPGIYRRWNETWHLVTSSPLQIQTESDIRVFHS